MDVNDLIRKLQQVPGNWQVWPAARIEVYDTDYPNVGSKWGRINLDPNDDEVKLMTRGGSRRNYKLPTTEDEQCASLYHPWPWLGHIDDDDTYHPPRVYDRCVLIAGHRGHHRDSVNPPFSWNTTWTKAHNEVVLAEYQNPSNATIATIKRRNQSDRIQKELCEGGH